MLKQFRDLTLFEINEEQMITIANDSCGGIGNKSNDFFKVDPSIVGYYTAIVALAETIAIGSIPKVIVNNLCVEMNNTGESIIDGIKKAMLEAGLNDILVTGSTEENMPVTVTGLGISVIGQIDKKYWSYPQIKKGAAAVSVGLPCVGPEVIENEEAILKLEHLKKIKQIDYIYDILPVGSKGILYEAKTMAESSQLEFIRTSSPNVDIAKSAGPATCAVLAIDKDHIDKFREVINLPINVIGEFV